MPEVQESYQLATNNQSQTLRKAALAYKHIFQKPSLCGPTSFQMILERHGYHFDQEEIAQDIGVKVAAHEIGAFSRPLLIGEGKDLGLNLEAFEGKQIKEFLTKHNIPLEPKVYYLHEITNVREFIYKNMKLGNDVMADIKMDYFKPELEMGHYCLVSEIDEDNLTICDPWPDNGQFWKTSVQELAKSMDTSHDGTERGFVVFSQKVTS